MSKFKPGDRVYFDGARQIAGTVIREDAYFFKIISGYLVQWDDHGFSNNDGLETVAEFMLDLIPYSVEGFEV